MHQKALARKIWRENSRHSVWNIAKFAFSSFESEWNNNPSQKPAVTEGVHPEDEPHFLLPVMQSYFGHAMILRDDESGGTC